MTRDLRLPTLSLCVLCASLLTAGGASAQSIGPDEAIGPDGAVRQMLQFSPIERSAIYNAAAAQRLRGSSRGVTPAIGAPVPPALALRDLPNQAALGTVDGEPLKYAMVEGEVVVIDPVRMRVVDVIRRGLPP